MLRRHEAARSVQCEVSDALFIAFCVTTYIFVYHIASIIAAVL